MKEKLERMFPGGEWGLGQRAWMVKSGTYFCAAADIVDGEIVLTDLGRELTGAVEKPIEPVEKAMSKAEPDKKEQHAIKHGLK